MFNNDFSIEWDKREEDAQAQGHSWHICEELCKNMGIENLHNTCIFAYVCCYQVK